LVEIGKAHSTRLSLVALLFQPGIRFVSIRPRVCFIYLEELSELNYTTDYPPCNAQYPQGDYHRHDARYEVGQGIGVRGHSEEVRVLAYLSNFLVVHVVYDGIEPSSNRVPLSGTDDCSAIELIGVYVGVSFSGSNFAQADL
jgi:hypothetical protein